MNMSRVKELQAPPERIQEAVVRGIAFLVLLAVLITLLFDTILPMYVLAVDFFIRACISGRFSLLALLSRKGVSQILRFKKRMIIARPKKFAAGIGFLLSLTALILVVIFDYEFWFIALSGMLGLFSALEAFFKFCAGCKIFGLLIRLGILREEVCYDCVLPGGEKI